MFKISIQYTEMWLCLYLDCIAQKDISSYSCYLCSQCVPQIDIVILKKRHWIKKKFYFSSFVFAGKTFEFS